MAAGTDFDAGIRTTEPVNLSTRCRTDFVLSDHIRL
jgi:hypothetical protein